jgi:hypothetical protein
MKKGGIRESDMEEKRIRQVKDMNDGRIRKRDCYGREKDTEEKRYEDGRK